MGYGRVVAYDTPHRKNNCIITASHISMLPTYFLFFFGSECLPLIPDGFDESTELTSDCVLCIELSADNDESDT
jgi:hypothetical protein